MTYKGSEINKQMLEPSLKQDIDNMMVKANNSWQRGQENKVVISNLSSYTAEKILYVTQSDWKATGNVEQLDINIPVGSAFSGFIKATYTSFWGGSDSHGGATVLYRIGHYTNQGTGTRLNDFVLETITPDFAKDYYIHRPYIHESNTITLIIQKAPNATNPFIIKLEYQGYNFGSKTAFQVMQETSFFIYDKGSPTDSGYPWTPQVSRIPTGAQTHFWDTSMWNDIVDGRNLDYGGVIHNLAQFSPEQFRDFLQVYLINKKGTFKCFITSTDLGISGTMDTYGVLTTIKPWDNETGGGLKQRFETSDVIFKRYQINATTWSAWTCTQSMDVDVIKLFQSASDVKNNVAQAITDKGVPTSPDATGTQMANNIRAIPSGNVYNGSAYIPVLSGSQTSNPTIALGYRAKNASTSIPGAKLIDGRVYQSPPLQSYLSVAFCEDIIVTDTHLTFVIGVSNKSGTVPEGTFPFTTSK